MDCEHDFHWYPSINEAGWRCTSCKLRPGEPAGYDPHLDRAELERKIGGLLLDMDHHKLISVSNGSHGDHIEWSVAKRCREAGLYDQSTIILYIVEEMQPGHAAYWQRISDGVVADADPRERCHCGALASIWRNGKASCFEHMDHAEAF